MTVQAPLSPPAAPEWPAPPAPPEWSSPPSGPEPEIDAGVIEDARRRQQRHRMVGAALMLGALIGGGLITGMFGGGGGGPGRGTGAQASGPNPGAGPGHVSASTGFPGAPTTQNAYGVSSGACPLAPSNHYLPPHSGCVTVRRADINGDGRPDLMIVYSRLASQRWPAFPGEPTSTRHDFSARAAFLKVVLAKGVSVTTRIDGVDGSKAATVDAIAHVNDDPGDEIFLEVGRISSGATGVAYGFHDGRLVPAGVYLSYDGDSGIEAGFNCVPGNPPRLIQRMFTFIGPDELTRSWRETEVDYVWHGPKLVLVNHHTFKRLVALKFKPVSSLKSSNTQIGTGCLRGVS